MFFMSRKRFDALSPEARKALAEVATEGTSREFGAFFYQQWEKARGRVVADPKHKVVQMDDAQVGSWQTKAQPVIADWVAGRAGRDKALEAYRSLYAEEKSR
jgi:TRAP-type C4-dicarboxylate transport system substrate-binding protein